MAMDASAGQQPQENLLLEPVENKPSESNSRLNSGFPRRSLSKLSSIDMFDFEPPDGGWGWIVCVVSFWTNATLFGIMNTFGILLVALVKEYGKEDDKSIAFKSCK